MIRDEFWKIWIQPAFLLTNHGWSIHRDDFNNFFFVLKLSKTIRIKTTSCVVSTTSVDWSSWREKYWHAYKSTLSWDKISLLIISIRLTIVLSESCRESIANIISFLFFEIMKEHISDLLKSFLNNFTILVRFFMLSDNMSDMIWCSNCGFILTPYPSRRPFCFFTCSSRTVDFWGYDLSNLPSALWVLGYL